MNNNINENFTKSAIMQFDADFYVVYCTNNFKKDHVKERLQIHLIFVTPIMLCEKLM